MGLRGHSDDDLKSILHRLPDALVVVDGKGEILSWNAQAERLFGWSAAFAVSRDFAELAVDAPFRTAFQNALGQCLSSHAGEWEEHLDATVSTSDQHTFPAEIRVTALPDETGATTEPLLALFIRDISYRQHMERRLSRLTLETRLLYQVATLATESESFEDALLNCVRITCDVSDWQIGLAYRADAQGRLAPTAVRYSRLTVYQAALDQYCLGETFPPGQGLAGLIWQSGEPEWIPSFAEDDRTHPCERAFGEATGLVGAFGFPVTMGGEVVSVLIFFSAEEVTPEPQFLLMVRSVGAQIGQVLHRKRAEEEHARLAAIVDSSYDAIIGKTPRGEIISWNQGAEQMYGYKASEALGQPISLIVPEHLIAAEPFLAEAETAGDRVKHLETIRRRKDGSDIHVSLTASPIVNAQGKVLGSSTIERNIADRIQGEIELRKAKEAAEQANLAKSQFLANVSHELRTPMNAIIGMTGLALGEELPADVRDRLNTARASADTMLYLVNDILDFSRLEMGKFELDISPFALRETLDETMKLLSIRAQEKGLELACHVQPDVPEWLAGERMRVRQILMNLVGNAIKFTEQGEVVVAVSLDSQTDTGLCLEFRVSDTGIGISPADQEKIFTPFAQADSSPTRRFSGVGLGLSICRELAALMGGRMWVESEPGQGASFFCTLRFERLTDPPRDSDASVEELKNLPVLVVDDNQTTRRLLEDSLTRWNMAPTVVGDAATALELLQEAARTNQQFPLVMVDALMPDMDGFSLIEKMQEDETHSGATVVMLSSSDKQQFRERIAGLDISACLEKPITQSDLLDSIMTALHGPQSQSKPVDELTRTQRTLSILVAEDTPANQKVVRAILEKRGHQVTITHNGREALDQLQNGTFDIVLMDVQMPTMDGLQATRAIRSLEREELASLPIVAMTAHAMRGDRERCLDAGMSAYISKPIDARKLVRLVEKLARDRDAHAEHAPVAWSRRTTSPDKIKALQSDDTPIDVKKLFELLDNDAAMALDMVEFGLNDCPELLEKIRAGIDSADFNLIARSAHSFKGLISNFGAENVTQTAQQLVTAAQKEQTEEIRPGFERLGAEFEQLIPHLLRLKSELS